MQSDTQNLTRQVLAYRKRAFGWRSIETHDALRFLAATTCDQDKMEEGESYYRQLLLWSENTFGMPGPSTYKARGDLVSVLSQ